MEDTDKTTGGYALHGAMCSWKAWNDALANGAMVHFWGNAGIDLPGTPEVGRWYRLEIKVTGNKVSFYVDDELLLERRDDSNPSGGVSLWAYDAIVELDNAVITGDDIPNVGPSGYPNKYLVQPKSKLTSTWGRVKSHK